ncbi:MAG: DNA alkylation repair protein [Candidatus Poribacteria bacterium]|nr:DNA alkylation repair protein [Candidatus Poribacteria bacterium]
MTFEEAVAQLEALGTEQNRKIYKRHGCGENVYGVSFADLNKLKKKIKKNGDLSRKLWMTGNVDAMTLAAMIGDPASLSSDELDAWVRMSSYYVVVGQFASDIAAKSPYAKERAAVWIQSDDEWVGTAGWGVVVDLVMAGGVYSDAELNALLETIEANIHAAPNRTRYSMNNALIAIGGTIEAFAETATATAKRIGKVTVDHGETGCKTPDAAPYIAKIWDRKTKKRA